MQPTEWIPLRWLAGPLDAALVEKPTPEINAAFDAWTAPAALKFLENGPVNCLVVNWSGGKPQDAAQQKGLRPLIEQARKQNLAVVARTAGAIDTVALKATGFSGAVGQGKGTADFPVIPLGTYSDPPAKTESGVIAIPDAFWARIPNGSREDSRVEAAAGPTGSPWVDSNGWVCSLLNAKRPGALPWLESAPPAGAMIRPSSYALAVADAGAYGARWIINFDPNIRKGLVSGSAEAVSVWKEVTAAVQFFKSHWSWASWRPVARLGVLSDFEGANEYMSHEILNLGARRHLQYRVLDRASIQPTSFDGLKGVLWVDPKPPTGAMLQQVQSFVNAGGLLIGPASVASLTNGLKPVRSSDNGYTIHASGSGQFAIARKPWEDPYLVAQEAHVILTRKYDLVRLWNASTTNAQYRRGPKGEGLVQVINYSGRAASHPMSLYAARKSRTARLYTLNADPTELKVEAKADGAEVALPSFPVYAAVEFGD